MWKQVFIMLQHLRVRQVLGDCGGSTDQAAIILSSDLHDHEAERQTERQTEGRVERQTERGGERLTEKRGERGAASSTVHATRSSSTVTVIPLDDIVMHVAVTHDGLTVSDGDDDYAEEGDDSEDSLRLTKGRPVQAGEDGGGRRRAVLAFLEEASLPEMLLLPGCSRKKAEALIDLRPFQTWEQLMQKLDSSRNLSSSLVHGCQEIIALRSAVQQLLQQCQDISGQMERVVSRLTGSAQGDGEDEDHLTCQPALMNAHNHPHASESSELKNKEGRDIDRATGDLCELDEGVLDLSEGEDLNGRNVRPRHWSYCNVNHALFDLASVGLVLKDMRQHVSTASVPQSEEPLMDRRTGHSPVETRVPQSEQGLELKPYQLIGLNWLRIMHTQHLNGILADEMGLGKTVQAIAFLAHLLEEGEEGPHVIIVPSSTIDNWLRELCSWCPALGVVVYYGSQEERRATRHSVMDHQREDFQVLLTTYNIATGSAEDRSLFKKFQFHYAVFDEGHMLKNMASRRFQHLMKISAERRLLLTGTPLQNNLVELMSLLCFVMPDIFQGKTQSLHRMFSLISVSLVPVCHPASLSHIVPVCHRCPCLSRSVPVCPPVSLCVPVCPPVSLSVTQCPPVSLFVPQCPCLSPSVPVCHPVSLSHSVPVCHRCPAVSLSVPQCPCLSHSVPVCPIVSLSVTQCRCLSHSVPVCHWCPCLSPSVPVCHPVSLSVTQCSCLSPSVPVCHPVSLSVTQCSPVSLSVPQCPCLSPSVPVCTPVSLSVIQCPPVSLFVPQCPCLSPSVPVCPPVSLSVPQCPCLSPSVPVCPPVSQSVTQCPPVSLSVPQCPCLSLSVPVCHPVSLSHSVPVCHRCPAVSLSVPQCPCLSHSVPVCPIVSLSVTQCRCLSHSVPVCHWCPCLSRSVPVCPPVSLSVPQCPCLSPSVPVCPPVSLSVPQCPSLSPSVPQCPCLSRSVPVCPSVSLSVPQCPCLSPSVLQCPCLSPSVPVCPPVSLSVPPSVPKCPCLSPSVPVCHPVSMSVTQCPPVSLSVLQCPCLSPSVPVCPPVSLSFPKCPCLSPSVPICPPVSLFVPQCPYLSPVSVCPPVSLYVTQCPCLSHSVPVCHRCPCLSPSVHVCPPVSVCHPVSLSVP
ncbi:hypothetical protein ACOMHN_060616 [Nucella lapillus]